MNRDQTPLLGGRFLSGIRGRLMMWFVAAAVGAVLPGTAVVYFSGLERIQDNLSQSFCQIAERSARGFETHLMGEFEFIQEVSNDTLTTQIMLERQGQFGDLAALQRTGDESFEFPTTDKVSDIHPELSFRLQVFRGLRSKVMNHLSIYDRGGNLVADSERENAIGRDEYDWYARVVDHKGYFRYLELSDDGRKLILVTPVWEGVGIIGYALGEFNFRALDDHTVQTMVPQFGGSGRTFMLNANGKLLHGEAFGERQLPLPDSILEVLPKTQGEAPVISKPFLMQNMWDRFSIWEQVACIAPLNEINHRLMSFGFPSWGVVVTQSPAESYATLFGSIRNFIIAGFIGAMAAAFVGVAMAWRITAPLKHLEEGVHRFAGGERDVQFAVEDEDEVGDLAREFNLMAKRVDATEQELKAFALAVENSADAIVMARPDGVIYYVNPSFENVTGYSRAEAVGKNPSILRVESTPDETYKSLWQSIIAKKPWRGELYNRRKNGEIYPVELTVSPVLDEHDEIISVLGIHRDITLAREYRENLEREVEERSRHIVETEGLTAVGRMASMIAHDLRNALSTVKMNLQILGRSHSDPDEVEHEYCRIGMGQIHYMEDFLTDILSYARPTNLQCDWQNLNEMVDEVLSSVSLHAVDKQVELSFDEGLNLPEVLCDRSRIVAVLRNLVDNAILAMPDGGKVRIATELMDAEGDLFEIAVSVTDNGVGISDEDRVSMFDPFFTTRAKGTGLGLAIAKRTIEQHGGEISSVSKIGEGTTICFTLPLQCDGC